VTLNGALPGQNVASRLIDETRGGFTRVDMSIAASEAQLALGDGLRVIATIQSKCERK
jgi:hypothetical protein